MAISIDYQTFVIYIPQDYLTPLGGDKYELDLNTFRLDLKALEESEEGMAFPDTHRHNTTVTLAGVTLARVVEIINAYTVTFEPGVYAVNAVGANSNIADVMNLNGVSLRTFNSAGLQVVVSGSGVTEQDKLDISDRVWDEVLLDHDTVGTTGKALAGAGAAGDPWGTPIPGAYGDGTAGKIIGTNLNAKVGDVKDKTDSLPDHPASSEEVATRLASADYVEPDNTVIGQIKTQVDFIRQIEAGKWKIVGSQMIFYAADGITPILTFNLYDKDGALVLATAGTPTERRPV